MLILKSFSPALGVRCPSPFGLKADALLAMSGLEYKIVAGDVRKAPKGKLPVLIDGNTKIPDTSTIQAYLETTFNIDFDGSLSLEQKAIARCIQRMVENHLYFAGIHFRWIENPDTVRDAFFSAIPSLIRKPLFNMILKKIKRDNEGHGIGRHSPAEILNFAKQDFLALSTLLDDKNFMFGERATSIDACVYGALEGVINVEIESEFKAAARAHENLVAYCDRFRGKYFAEDQG